MAQVFLEHSMFVRMVCSCLWPFQFQVLKSLAFCENVLAGLCVSLWSG